MAPDETILPSSSAGKKARRLRIIAVVIASLGIAGGCATFWGSAGHGGLSDDMATVVDSKVLQSNIERYSGKMGLFASNLTTELQDPGTRAAVIVVAALLVAGICLYVTRLLDRDNGR